jgi:hypothetical protein
LRARPLTRLTAKQRANYSRRRPMSRPLGAGPCIRALFPDCSLMTCEEIEFVVRAGLGRNEWVLLISFPDNIGGNPSVVNFSGSQKDALAEAKKRIDNWGND